ncbi:MAG TPA: hypothetical protein VKP69_13155 [Isosphaeraceae bacterium]|nr:hypothetical protein [Isosphaeraceae bacterium]
MRTNSRRRFRSPVAWALALVVGTPALAQAQQSGLFPLAPIRRERVPCPLEDPVYQLYRHEYFGYHPTCWRRFPPGWGCPSPEPPNAAESFQRQPLVKPPALAPLPGEEPGAMPGGEPGAGETPPAPGAPGTSPLPPLPPARSPFDIDTGTPGAPPPDTSAPPGRTTPEVAPPAERTRPAEPGPGPLEPSRPSTGPTSLLGPTEAPGTPAPPTHVEPRPTAPPTGPNEPLLALPDPSAPPPPSSASEGAMPPGPTLHGSGVISADPTPSITAPPAQATPRRSLIGTLFSGLRRRR